MAVIGTSAESHLLQIETEREGQARSAAFRHLVVKQYRHQCAACGVRLQFAGGTLVEAAHLIPFCEARDDRPANGIALCPNHHWAMDSNLIAPCPDRTHQAGIWRIHESLDDRIDHQGELVRLSGRRVIEPEELKFYPDPMSLAWRETRLNESPAGGM